jgi:23S rRNA (adenine2503-C2)-methyltransferase
MLNKEELTDRIQALKIEKFRSKQMLHAVFHDGLRDFSGLTTLPANIRPILKEAIKVYSIECIRSSKSKDGATEKTLFQTGDGCKVESVLMRFKDGRNSVCVSSQVGCRLGCKFCATGTLGFNRNLTYQEIADQVLFYHQLLLKEGTRITNIIFMGMGEPFLNYDEVIKCVRFLNDPDCFNIGARNITISTSGICDGIEKLARENLQVNLAVSLHAANQQKRESIMPVAKMFSMERLFESLKKYIEITNRRVSFEYIMLKGVNDSIDDARDLANLTKNMLCHINLIPYNATGIAGMVGSGKISINRFKEVLDNAGIPVTVRVSMGKDIDAACGQLANKL